MRKIVLFSLILLCGCSQQNQLPEPNTRISDVAMLSEQPQSRDAIISKDTFSQLENAYLDLLLKDQVLNNLIKYANDSHISDATCYDDNDEIPICVAIDKQVTHLDNTQNYSAYDVMQRYNNQHDDNNKKIIALHEAELLLHKFQESK